MDSTLKQRLIGAVVLVALAVIFLPMLIKGPAPDSGVSDVSLDVPATPAGEYETRELPLVTPGDIPQGGVVGLGGRPPSVAAAAPNVPTDDDSAKLPAATVAGDYAVSFGAYATIADADAVIARLKQSGLPGYREPAIINGNTAYRVRIGPYVDRADAESARLQGARIRNDVKAQVITLDAPSATLKSSAPNASTATPASTSEPAGATAAVSTTALPPEPARPVVVPKAQEPAKAAAPPPYTPTPSTPTPSAMPAASGIGFAVQLGAFSKATDANALRDKLRAAGFSAFVQQVQTDKGSLSRVRVGPVVNRADAHGLRSQVAAKLGLDGLVTSHP